MVAGLVLAPREVWWPPEVDFLAVVVPGVAASFGIGNLLAWLPEQAVPPEAAGRCPGWPAVLIRDLGRAAEGTEAVKLSEALARVDPARRAFFGGQAALALAEAGLADDARVKIAEQVERWPDDAQTRMLAGDALALLGDAEAALAQYQAALPLAQQAKDYRAARELSGKIFRLTHSGSAQPAVQRRQPRSKPSKSQRKGKR